MALGYGANTRRNQPFILALVVAGLAIPMAAQATTATSTDRHRRIVLVSIVDRKLAVMDGDEVIATFPVAVGATKSPSPIGVFQIVSRVPNPTYYRPGTVIPSGKNNPLGTRWVGLSEKGYGIHGTNAPGSVGHAASHGCIRLRNRDMEKFFTMVRVGDSVEIWGDGDARVAQVFGSDADETTLATAQVAGQGSGQ
jgi:lipoprotein-anchoring transpeptidase ErfK/SrfK